MLRLIRGRRWMYALVSCVIVAYICLFAAIIKVDLKWIQVDLLKTFCPECSIGSALVHTTAQTIHRTSDDQFKRTSAFKGNSTSTGTTQTLIRTTLQKQKDPSWDSLAKQWTDHRTVMCDENIVGFNYQFLQMKDAVLVNPLFLGPRGGENITDVIMRNEDNEYYKPLKGAVMAKCRTNAKYVFRTNPTYTQLFDALHKPNIRNETRVHVINEVTLLVIRREYANLYHTMTDWYNVYLTARYFNVPPDSSIILFFDAHPSGNLDDVWSILFNKYVRFRELPSNYTLFRELIWVAQGYDSPIELFSPTNPLPLVEEFRQFVYERFHLSKNDINRALNCQNVSVLFIWRRNYVAHPRNPAGRVTRQITNENELIANLTHLIPNCNFRGLQMDALPMSTQLRHILQTDILVGMHGAGLMNTIFLPSHAGLIELAPSYPAPGGDHFIKMASWRKLQHSKWRNTNNQLERGNTHTYVPVNTMQSLLQDMIKQIHC